MLISCIQSCVINVYVLHSILLAVESFCIPGLLLSKSSGHTKELQPEQ